MLQIVAIYFIVQAILATLGAIGLVIASLAGVFGASDFTSDLWRLGLAGILISWLLAFAFWNWARNYGRRIYGRYRLIR